MKVISASEVKENPFDLLNKTWGLVTAGNEDKCNTMTVSWGGVGVFWNKPVATIYIRPQRYTKTFIDQEETFSISFLGDEYRETLTYCGRTSGADVEDKWAGANLTPTFDEGTPYVKEAKMVFVCKKLCEGDIEPEGILDPANDEANYPNKDYHRYYIAEITKVLVEE